MLEDSGYMVGVRVITEIGDGSDCVVHGRTVGFILYLTFDLESQYSFRRTFSFPFIKTYFHCIYFFISAIATLF